jgi:ubiquinone biosynthesis monooxygenase Coq7
MGYDITIIRPQMRREDFAIRGRDFDESRRNALRKALRTLHTLELMAQTIYRFQITSEPTELNRQLIAAMCNEMTHFQDFQVKLYEFGFTPSILRPAYLVVGFLFGFLSRLRGKAAILKTGIWVETKAVHHYAELLATVPWDDETRKVVEKDSADEDGHIETWKRFLAELNTK